MSEKKMLKMSRALGQNKLLSCRRLPYKETECLYGLLFLFVCLIVWLCYVLFFVCLLFSPLGVCKREG